MLPKRLFGALRQTDIAGPGVAFNPIDFPIVREAGHRLRESIEPRRARVEGPVVSLQAKPPRLYEGFQGRVIIRTMIAGSAARVRFLLNQDDYGRACDAHRDQRRVSATGILKRDPKAKLFDLLHPQDFQVLEVETAAP